MEHVPAAQFKDLGTDCHLLTANSARKNFIIILSFESQLPPKGIYFYFSVLTFNAASVAALNDFVDSPLALALITLLNLGDFVGFKYFPRRNHNICLFYLLYLLL